MRTLCRNLRVVGEDVSEMLDLIAAQMKVVQIARLKTSCRRCERMVQVPAPSRPIPGSMADAALCLNCPGFTGGQNSRRIARYGTDIKEEDLEAVFP